MITFESVIEVCQDIFNNCYEADNARIYADSRISKDGQLKFSLGYFPTAEQITLLTSQISEEELEELSLTFQRSINDSLIIKKERYWSLCNNNLIMPYKDVYGEIIAIVGRTLLTDEEIKNSNIDKYKNTSFNKSKHLFGLFEAKHSILKNNIVIVVEGQFDCITCHDNGITNVVALGSTNMSFSQLALLTRYTTNIILLLDNDEAGKSGTAKILKKYGKYANFTVKKLPPGYKDIDEYIKDSDGEYLNIMY